LSISFTAALDFAGIEPDFVVAALDFAGFEPDFVVAALDFAGIEPDGTTVMDIESDSESE
jgi:hypothetical protein